MLLQARIRFFRSVPKRREKKRQKEREKEKAVAKNFQVKCSTVQCDSMIALFKRPFSIADASQTLNVQVYLHSEYDRSS